jgi:hypothetical protein
MSRQQILLTLLLTLVPLGCASNGGAGGGAGGGGGGGGGETPPAQPRPAAARARAAADPVYAYIDAVRRDLSDGKVQLINSVMRLSAAESKVFWPLYHDYEDELFTLGDRRVELTRSFVTAQASGALDDQRAAALADDWFGYESQRLQLLRKYHNLMAQQLSPLRATQFTQIEHRVGTVVDLVIASELPLVDAEATKGREQASP